MRKLPFLLIPAVLAGLWGNAADAAAIAGCDQIVALENSVLELHSGPSPGARMVTAIQPGTANQICRHDAVSGSDGDWIQVTGGAAEGWVAADKVASMFSPQRAEEIIAPAAKQVLQRLKSMDFNTLAMFVHPVKGVRFSPYAFISRSADRHMTRAMMRSAWTDRTKHLWGDYDGTGDPIRLTFSAYYRRFIFDADFSGAKPTYNAPPAAANTTRDNLREEYPNAIVVETPVSGRDPEREGMDHATLRLVFEQHKDRWYLVHIVHDQWTI